MFLMMNVARFSIGVQSLGIAERAYQQALEYAKGRRQGAEGPTSNVLILRHPDVRRMLLTMKSMTEAMRAVSCAFAEAVDQARASPDLTDRQRSQALVALLTPIIKGWYSESVVNLASLCIQVHGGTGYIEESGVPQLLRDARITPIYEGTTGIQATDLVGRKIIRDGGQSASDLCAEISLVTEQLARSTDGHLNALANTLGRALRSLDRSIRHTVASGHNDMRRALCGAQPLLNLFGVVIGGWQLARAALAAQRRLRARAGDRDFLEGKILTARFYGDHILSQAGGYEEAVTEGADALLEIRDDQL
jgi:acyl-CoA dehydrogenase